MSYRLIGGVVGGLVGGVVFGIMMTMMGMIGMVAGLVGASGAGAGWLVHLVIAAIIGLGYGVVSLLVPAKPGPNAGLGAVYGLVWWVLGPLLIMPAMMGGQVLAITSTSLQSLVGHLVYGVVTGLVAAAVARRAGEASGSPSVERA